MQNPSCEAQKTAWDRATADFTVHMDLGKRITLQQLKDSFTEMKRAQHAYELCQDSGQTGGQNKSTAK
jgi:hypothetical protein